MDDASGNWPKWLSGTLNVVSGFAQGALGAALGATVGWTGIGAVAAGFLILNGAATATQGIGQIVNAATKSSIMREDNIIRTGVQYVGRAIGGNVGATAAGMVYDTAVMVAAVYAPTVGTVTTSASTPTSAVSGACFVAGTTILTADGYVPIEDIRPGDFVFSENPGSGEKAVKEVVQVFVRETRELIHILIDGEKITTTPEHPFFVYNQGWVSAANLQRGNVVVLRSGETTAITDVDYELVAEPVTVYNFEVADFHTYYVGESSILVHNTCGQQFTPNQDALIKLAREYKNGISREDASILIDWAKEYGISYHYPMTHPGRSGIWSQIEHINIFNLHIPIT